jgi:nucleotide-binding universal stress UspA family protein
VEAKLRDYTQAIEQVGVAVVRLIHAGSPRKEVVRVAEEIGADGLVIGSHSKRPVFDLGGTAQAICQRARATVVMASPAQRGEARPMGKKAMTDPTALYYALSTIALW